MRVVERAGLKALSRMDPERAHGLALKILKAGLAPRSTAARPGLSLRFAGLDLPNPVGLAAGFDKHAEAIDPLLAAGFGFLEIGGVTPRPQPGNPKPRLFRLSEDQAVINRFGFNSDGMDVVARRLEARGPGVVGINLGANKESEDKTADFIAVLERCGPFVDFATVNVSSPNTAGLRDLQGEALGPLLCRVQEANAAMARPVPLMVKLAPDLEPEGLDQVAWAAEAAALSAIVATNTTVARQGLQSHHRRETGGLSGAPLKAPALDALKRLRGMTDLPIIGVGGIASAEDAAARLDAGAGAVQLYSALVFEGLSLVDRILSGLAARSSAG
ncbi:MAG: quinone-dependent dihydroorotate dehydrogenase [Pseudomonadota bacterium]